jgi:hypothetical protein
MKLKVLDFKSISPFFEQCRDGHKMFDVRLYDGKDKRFHALSQLAYGFHSSIMQIQIKNWGIRFTNPATGEQFTRELLSWNYLSAEPKWVIMYLGEKVEAHD